MMDSSQSKDLQKADPLADALERLERSVANREKARMASLADSGLEFREKECIKVTESSVTESEVNTEVVVSGDGGSANELNKKNAPKKNGAWSRATSNIIVQLSCVLAVGYLLLPVLKEDILKDLLMALESDQRAAFEEKAKITEELNTIGERIDSLSGELKSITQLTEVSSKDVYKELVYLRERNKLITLGDSAIHNSDRASLDQLLRVSEESEDDRLKTGAASEILRVKFAYMNGLRRGTHTIPVGQLFPDQSLKNETELDTNQLIELLDNAEAKVDNRVRAAYLLADKRNSKAADALAKVVETDLNLDVVREAAMTFSEMTGFKNEDLLNTDVLLQWWMNNSDQVRIMLSN
ncbi:hypothetical protein OAF65_00775 [Verrucomicrobiales bacterium]|nr:hypothetical protein [Verrucomicrobiales bacterium]